MAKKSQAWRYIGDLDEPGLGLLWKNALCELGWTELPKVENKNPDINILLSNGIVMTVCIVWRFLPFW